MASRSSSEGSSLSPRHRPDLKTLAKNSTEQDLWDLDEPLEAMADLPSAPRLSAFPPRPSAPPTPADAPLPALAADAPTPVLGVPALPQRKISQNPHLDLRRRSSTPPPTAATADPESTPSPLKIVDALEDTFNNFDDWHQAGELPTADSARPYQVRPPAPASAASPVRQVSMPDEAPATELVSATAAESDRDEFSPRINPHAKPISLRPKLGLTKMEILGLISLVSMLLLGGFWVYQNSLSRLRNQATQTRKIIFPIKGERLTVTKVVTYWRAPVTKMGQVETVRRGVVLIPVTELTLRGGPGAIRLLVHNERGTAVGDPITRQVDGDTTLILPATDGFEDVSMHAVYLTAQSKPWTLHLLEAPSANAPRQDFQPLLELPISTEKR